jgi:hypothetical protein
MQQFTVAKRNGVMQYTDMGGYESRNASCIWCINQANLHFGWDDFPELTIHTGDYEPSPTVYTFSKHNSTVRTVPDFNFHAWPEVGIDDYEQTVDAVHERGLQPAVQHKVGWIGSLHTCATRQAMFDIGRRRPDLFDIREMQWTNSGQTRLGSTQYISLPDLVAEYSILVDIEGNGYSGRLKYLLWSHRPLLLVDRPHREFFFDAFEPWVHYIPVDRTCSDLLEKAQWCVDHYPEAMQMAERAYQKSRETLTRLACYRQWDRVVAEWRRVAQQCTKPERVEGLAELMVARTMMDDARMAPQAIGVVAALVGRSASG